MIRWLAALALAAVETPTSAPPVVAMTGDQALAVINADWSSRGERPFTRVPGREAAGVSACADGDLCVLLAGSGGQVRAITLSAPAGTRESAARYLSAQSLLVRMTAPGAPVLPAVTADRIAVSGDEPAEAQLGPTCMRVQRSNAGALSTTFSRRRCSVDQTPSP